MRLSLRDTASSQGHPLSTILAEERVAKVDQRLYCVIVLPEHSQMQHPAQPYSVYIEDKHCRGTLLCVRESQMICCREKCLPLLVDR